MSLLKTPGVAGEVWAMPPVGAVRCVHAAGAALGEGVLWSVREQALYWVDILGRQLHRWRPDDGERAEWAFDEEISAVAERRDAPGLLVTLRRGLVARGMACPQAQRVAAIWQEAPQLGQGFTRGGGLGFGFTALPFLLVLGCGLHRGRFDERTSKAQAFLCFDAASATRAKIRAQVSGILRSKDGASLAFQEPFQPGVGRFTVCSPALVLGGLRRGAARRLIGCGGLFMSLFLSVSWGRSPFVIRLSKSCLFSL